MRIAIANAYAGKVGGAEGYLDEVIPELSRAGYEISFLFEFPSSDGRPPIRVPDGCPKWCVAEIGAEKALAELSLWRPDLIYVHKIEDLGLESRMIDLAPSLLFVHDYRGTCISGSKTFRFPVTRPCDRRFGPSCLCLYFPRRCGGRSPITMFRLYNSQSKRLKLLHRYRAIITYSEHMRDEFLKHGFPEERVHQSLYMVEGIWEREGGAEWSPCDAGQDFDQQELPSRLLFLGRMEQLKGGDVLLDALPTVAAKLDRPIQMTFGGDGRMRRRWERQARRIEDRDSRVKINFCGWLSAAEIGATAAQSDLLVMPSLWPEPFGRVGPEAGLRGLPVAAFAVGGISEWLINGVNGFLAPGDPPTARGLAEVIVKCLCDRAAHARLRRGAYEVAARLSVANHLKHLTELFSEVAA